MVSRQRSRTRGPRTRTRRPARAPGRKPSARRATKPARRETLRVRAYEPTFTVDDIARSERFYTEVIGFVVDQRWSEEGQLKGLLLKAGDSRLGLSQDDWAKGRDRARGVAVRIWCTTVQDVNALAERVKAAGHPLAEEPKDQPWGGRSFAVDDPPSWVSEPGVPPVPKSMENGRAAAPPAPEGRVS